MQACPDKKTPPEEKTNPYKIVQGGYPNWSPTGERLAFIRNDSLFLYYFDSEIVEFIAQGATEPSFAPDGMELAFERDRKIYTIDLDTKIEQFIANGIIPSWSNNGQWIAFAHEEATRVLTDGTRVWGEPTPDSSLYYYDLESDSIFRVIVENADSLFMGEELSWPGEKLSLSHPEWAVHDSVLFFYTGRGMWKVRPWGGISVRLNHQFEDEIGQKLLISQSDINIPYDQMDWSEFQERVAYMYVLDNRPFSGITKHIEMVKLTAAPGFGISSGYSDPSWSPFGLEIALFRDKDSCIVIYDLSWVDEYLNKP